MELLSGIVETGLGADGKVKLPFGKYYDLMSDWRFILVTCVAYLLVVNRYNAFVQSKTKALNPPGTKKQALVKYKSPIADSMVLKVLVFSHNVSLSIFSGKVFTSVISNWLHDVFRDQPYEVYCDTHGSVWNKFMFHWAWMFYLSKYYEFIDTMILMLKGKKVTTLQSYHHAGAVISMWLIIIGQAAGSWAFVMFNSFVHTIMYCYYASTTLGLKPAYKSLLTTLQIVQFGLGVPVSLSYLLIPKCLRKVPGREHKELTAYFFVALYLLPLMHMFIKFAKSTFYPRPPAPKASDTAVVDGKVSESAQNDNAEGSAQGHKDDDEKDTALDGNSTTTKRVKSKPPPSQLLEMSPQLDTSNAHTADENA